MNRLDRLQAILIQLQSKKIVKAQEIADRFEISLRTVYRDVKSLEESGVPIGAEAGIGYFLLDNYSLPPVMFTHEEASSLIFGEKLIEKMSDARVRSDFESAVMKIKAILRPSEKDLFEKLHNHIAVYNVTRSEEDTSSHYLYELQHAIANKRVLRICYQAQNQDDPITREVESIGLCNYSNHWHLIAWCRLRSDYRDFRTDRIQSLKILDESFRDKEHLSLAQFMQTMLPPVNGEPNISIVVSKEKSSYIGDTKFWYGFIREEKVDEERFRMYFSNTELKGFAAWILNTGCQAQIEKPAELLENIQQFVRQAMHSYLEQK